VLVAQDVVTDLGDLVLPEPWREAPTTIRLPSMRFHPTTLP
jgi:hypothetical protein